MSDTDPSTGPSVEREAPEAGNLEHPRQVAGNFAPEEQNASNQSQPEEGVQIQKVLNLLNGMNNALQARQIAVLAHIKVPLSSLLPVVDNLYGEGRTTEVQAPILDQPLLEDPAHSPSAPPEFLVDQVFQTKPFEEVHEPKFVHEGCSIDQLTYSGQCQREARAKETHQAQLHADQIPKLEHDARWEAVDHHPGRSIPTDRGQEPQKTPIHSTSNPIGAQQIMIF